MSFKRDGDDGSQLNLLKKRRVAELLAKDIPDDEAVLMSNGRYACTVCHYKPVFDTVDMLTVHRAGKKHQHATEKHFTKKRELALLVQKRRIQAEVKKESQKGNREEEEPSPLLQKVEAAKRHTLLKQAPYNPCHTYKAEGPSKKSKNKLFFQGIRQHNFKNAEGNSSSQKAENSNSANQDRVLSHHISESTETCAAAQQTPAPGFSNTYTPSAIDSSAVAHNNIVIEAASKPTSQTPAPGFSNIYTPSAIASSAVARNNIVIKAASKPTAQTPAPGVSRIQIKPYIPKAKRTAVSSQACLSKQPGHASTDEKPLSTSTSACHNPSSFSTHSPVRGEEVIHDTTEFIREFCSTDNRVGKDDGTTDAITSYAGHTGKHSLGEAKDLEWSSKITHPIQSLNVPRLDSGELDKEKREKRKDTKMRGAEEDKAKRTTAPKDTVRITDEKRKELQRYLELTSAGWVQDNAGNWVKGEDVEFDSDEETPTS